jgi:hypothetical protein
MERLRTAIMRVRRADIQAAEFEIRPENHLDRLQHLRRFDDRLEDPAFIDRVGDAARARFGFEFAARAVAFEGESSAGKIRNPWS